MNTLEKIKLKHLTSGILFKIYQLLLFLRMQGPFCIRNSKIFQSLGYDNENSNALDEWRRKK